MFKTIKNLYKEIIEDDGFTTSEIIIYGLLIPAGLFALCLLAECLTK